MKTKRVITVCIHILAVAFICFAIFMIHRKYQELYLHNIIKAKQIITNPYNRPSSPRLPTVIPMKLFQTWHSKELPPKMQENVESLKKHNPELEYFLYDDKECANFIKNNFSKDVVTAYNRLVPGAYKADLWRYCVMYIQGGVYLDIKYKCADGFKFADIMDREHFVLDTDPGNWKRGTHGIYNALIIAKPGNPLFLKCIQSIVRNTQTNYYGFNWLYPTGPGLLGELYFGNIHDNVSMAENFDLVHDNINKTALVIYKNQIILQEYPEYRMEQLAKQKQKHYGDLWKERAIYTF
jgi:mannosyltransferase OCH1-like enzyme